MSVEADNSFSGEPVENSATDTPASESDTNSQPEENVWEAIQNGTDETVVQDDAEEIPTDEEESELADDQIPAEDEETGDEEEKPLDEKPKSRSQNFKDLQATNAALEADKLTRDTEFQALNTKVATLDTALEAYGGVEQVATLVENQNKFIDPARHAEAVDYMLSLPQSSVIVSEILNRSFNLGEVALDEASSERAMVNRVEVVNSALAKDFGLTAKLSPDQMTRVFEYIAVRANSDMTVFLDDISDEIDILTPPENKKIIDPETQKEIDELKAKLGQTEDAKKTPEKKEENAPLDFEKVTKTLNDYESSVIGECAAVVLKDYNKTLDTLSPYQAKALSSLVRTELGGGKIFIQLADYLINNPEHSNAKFLKGQFKTEVQTLMRGVAKEILGKPSAPSPKPTGLSGQTRGTLKTQAAPGGKKNAWAEILDDR